MSVRKNVQEGIAVLMLVFLGLFAVLLLGFIFANLGPTNAGLLTSDNAYNSTARIQNLSLAAGETYANNADTQVTVVSVYIILLLLVGIFVYFAAQILGGKMMGGRKSSSSGFN